MSVHPDLAPLVEPSSGRESVLVEAERIINGERQADYGHPLDDFTKTAQFWSTYLTAANGAPVNVTEEDVGLMMVLLKVSRQLNRPQRDNLVDAAGYIGTVQKVEEERARRATCRSSTTP